MEALIRCSRNARPEGATSHTFAHVAEAYLETRTDLAPRTLSKARWQLRAFLNTENGCQRIGEITAPQLLAALRKIEKTGKLETAHKSKELAGRVCMFAIADGDKGVDRNPAADLKLAVAKPADVGKRMRAIEEAKGFQPATLAALKLLPQVFLWPG